MEGGVGRKESNGRGGGGGDEREKWMAKFGI